MKPTRAIVWSSRHGIGWAVAGALVGLMDALLAITRPGTESLQWPVVAATLTLDVTLHILLGAVLGLALGRGAVLAATGFWSRWCRLTPRTRRWVAGLSGVAAGAGLALAWAAIGQWIEWDAVDWRLPLLALSLPIVGLAASELPDRSRQLIVALGLLVIGGVTGANLWSNGAQSTGDAAARLGQSAASGQWLVIAARGALDGDGDGFPGGLCAGDCDCDDDALEVHPGAAEVADNGVDEDCDGQDLSHAATLLFAQLMEPETPEEDAVVAATPPPEPFEMEVAEVDLAWLPTELGRIYSSEPLIPFDAFQGPPAATGPPNMLFITIDTLRADHLGFHGYSRATSPNLDRLAERCAIFDQARATGSQTRFSVPPMVTGKYFTEIARTEGLWPRILDEEVTVAEQLDEGGYHTAAFHSISYLRAMYGFSQGFDHYDSSVLFERPNSRFKPTSDYVTDKALAYVDGEAFAKQTDEDPFFLWVYYSDPHSPYIFHRGFPSFGPWMKDVYDNEVAYTDHHVGRLLAGLEARGLLDDTLIVLTSDHGEGLDEAEDHGHRYHGPNLHDEVVRVPLMVCGAGVVPRRVSTSVSLIDLAPTFVDIAGLDPSPSHRGVSLDPWLRGRDPAHPPVFFEKHKDSALPQKGMVLWPHKVILKMPYNQVKIYDLVRDPRERFDLAEDLAAPLRSRLVGLLNHWANEVLEVRDPLRVQTAQAP